MRSPSAPASSSSVRRTSFAPAGFLIRRIETRLARRPRSSRPGRTRPASTPAPCGRLGRAGCPSRSAAGERRERVVDVVEAGEREAQLDLAAGGRAPRPASPRIPSSSISVAATSGAGRSAPQFGQRVVAEVADEGPLVRVGGPAAPAVLGVEGVLELRQRLARVLDPEVGDAGAPAPGRGRGRGRRPAGRRRQSTNRSRPAGARPPRAHSSARCSSSP